MARVVDVLGLEHSRWLQDVMFPSVAQQLIDCIGYRLKKNRWWRNLHDRGLGGQIKAESLRSRACFFLLASIRLVVRMLCCSQDGSRADSKGRKRNASEQHASTGVVSLDARLGQP